ncbi:autotransporter domain-containing protein [Xenorhabdus sp. KJ12.1]|uniref:autotransporter domain-containing protein n=1 Tax=Xenorhabdus sp. KJ12.1 TaxID=1851571 RepID=UPI000C03FDC2|nr:autotransporter domain-containing protein [Xenorhabdus sp. KJ12.1]PHM68421.1 outer membrane esterase [Xenorhabdus sp. KJ12.1]
MKKAFLFTPALLALSISTISNAHAYDHLYVFGDSLSDTGNTKGVERFTTDGKTSQLYNEYLAKKLANIELKPSSEEGGTNYSQAGSTALKEYSERGLGTKEQVSQYLAQHNQQADSNGIYIHWVGGNDLAAALIAGSKNPKDPSESYDIVGKSATEASRQITQLVNAGAGLVIAPTVPDVGTTPRMLETLLSQAMFNQALVAKGIDPNVFNEPTKDKKEAADKVAIEQKIKNDPNFQKASKETLTLVHDGINSYETPSGVFRNKVLEGTLKVVAAKAAAKSAQAEIDKADTPEKKAKVEAEINAKTEELYKQLITAYNGASEGATKLTDAYNELVDKQISESKGNILRADINGLLKEVIDNPYSYGIQNTLGYACPQGQSASECVSKIDGKDNPEFNNIREFLFADQFHPTPLAHKIMGQYIESIYIAPSQVMTLNQVNRAPVKGTRASLDGHLQQLRSGGNEQGKTGVFGGYSGGRNTTFTLGGDYQLTESLLLGALYSNDNTERSPTSNFSYQSDAHVATAYGLWNVFNKAWLSGDLHYADINYDSLTRSIKLGQATRREVGSTTGTQWGARLTANWDIPVTNIVTTSPIVQFSWDKGDVKGYRESGHQSSAMHFSDQSYTSKIATLGWRVDTQLGRFNPYASVQFNHQFGDTQSKMRSAINSTKTSFVVDSGKQSKDWRQYTVGANANLFGNVRGFASVTRNEGSAQDANYDFSLGINASF